MAVLPGSPIPRLRVLLCAPRGFCAGVVRAIDAVERALQKYGPPVYVRHEIVHNKYVVESLRRKGAIFVEELTQVPDGDRPVIFSAHGVPKAVPAEAADRKLFAIDATCPLVTKVHREAMVHAKRGPRNFADRPRRTSRNHRHHGSASARQRDADRNRG
jgi:4-hydroxy-3-methylbut-2-enyl diphosphate reductase